MQRYELIGDEFEIVAEEPVVDFVHKPGFPGKSRAVIEIIQVVKVDHTSVRYSVNHSFEYRSGR